MSERAYADLCQSEPFIAALIAGGFTGPADLPRGALVARCDLVDVQPIAMGSLPDEPERSLGNYAPGRYAWHLAHVQALTPPIPATGAQGLWTWAGELPPEDTSCASH
jgi:hypothetical protein